MAIQIEDFSSPSDTVAMSSVPVQFLILVTTEIVNPGNEDVTEPIFVGDTPEDRAYFSVPLGSTWHEQITAMSGGEGVR